MAQYGIAFYGETRSKIAPLLKQCHTMQGFDYFMHVLHILNVLSKSSDFELLHNSPYINPFKKRDQDRLRAIYEVLEKRYHTKISLEEIAGTCNLGKEAFCRYFKKETGSTFITFLNQYRVSQAKRLLLAGKNVTEAFHDSGFESLSYFTRVFKKVTGENPSKFKQRMTN